MKKLVLVAVLAACGGDPLKKDVETLRDHVRRVMADALRQLRAERRGEPLPHRTARSA